MKSVLALLLTIGGSGFVTWASSAESQGDNDVDSLKRFARYMGDAMVATDMVKLGEIYADDWTGLSPTGKLVTKREVLRQYKSGENRLVSYTLGPIDVQVHGNVAVSHGSVSEQRIWRGTNEKGKYVWMDIMEKRDGKWKVVRSASASIE